jgi:hypothetical protein
LASIYGCGESLANVARERPALGAIVLQKLIGKQQR